MTQIEITTARGLAGRFTALELDTEVGRRLALGASVHDEDIRVLVLAGQLTPRLGI